MKYYLVRFDDGEGNMDTEGENKDGVGYYLYKEGFKCKAGFWGCPWYFIDIKNKVFLPGRPGIGYGEVIGDQFISFETFKGIYNDYKNNKKKHKKTSVLK